MERIKWSRMLFLKRKPADSRFINYCTSWGLIQKDISLFRMEIYFSEWEYILPNLLLQSYLVRENTTDVVYPTYMGPGKATAHRLQDPWGKKEKKALEVLLGFRELQGHTVSQPIHIQLATPSRPCVIDGCYRSCPSRTGSPGLLPYMLMT